jgi:ABC-type sugar transport system substrate-binding protein
MKKRFICLVLIFLVMGMIVSCTTTTPQPTAAPVQPTAAPVQPTAAPVQPTAAPIQATSAPTAAAAATQEVIQLNPAKGSGTVYYIGMIGNNIWEVTAAKTFEKYAKQLGYDIKEENANNSADNQINQLDSVIPLKPKAVFLKSVDVTMIAETVQKAVQAGVPVITFDGSVTAKNPSLNVDVGLVKYGNMAAEEILKYLKTKYGTEKGKILNLQGDISVPYSPLMTKGFHEILDKYPNITIIDKDTKGWEITAAANVASDVLTVNKDVDAMFVHTDSRFPGVVSVLQEKGYKKGDVYLIGVDGDPTAIEYIRQGWVNATLTPPMDQYVFGCFAFLDQIIAGTPLTPGLYNINGITAELRAEKWGFTLYLPGILITKQNADDPSLWGNQKLK